MSQKSSQKSRIKPKSKHPISAISAEKSKSWRNIKTSISNLSAWREVTSQLIATTIIGGVSIFAAYLSEFPPFQGTNKQQTELLTGIWNIFMEYNIPNGAYSQEGRIEYSKSGDYNFSGRLIFDITKDKKNSKIIYHAQASGSWQIKDNHLFIRLKDLKTTPLKILDEDGRDLTSIAVLMRGLLPNFEYNVPKETTQELKIIKLTQTEFHTQGHDLYGVTGDCHATRMLNN